MSRREVIYSETMNLQNVHPPSSIVGGTSNASPAGTDLYTSNPDDNESQAPTNEELYLYNKLKRVSENVDSDNLEGKQQEDTAVPQNIITKQYVQTIPRTALDNESNNGNIKMESEPPINSTTRVPDNKNTHINGKEKNYKFDGLLMIMFVSQFQKIMKIPLISFQLKFQNRICRKKRVLQSNRIMLMPSNIIEF